MARLPELAGRMKYATLASGIEAATVAWQRLGWTPLWFSEIDPFCNALLGHHYPDIPNLGDINKIQDAERADLIMAGTPCQSFSIAGLRKGMDDPRGNLTLVFLAIVDRLRPRWVVWENVPGVLSSNKGRDFGAILGALEKIGYGWAYRILDAQYFGVAQRRRRVFLVGYPGDRQCAAAVLFERSCLSGHPPPSREKGKRVAPSVQAGAPFSGTGNDRVEAETMIVAPLTGNQYGDHESRESLLVPEISMALNAHRGSSRRMDSESETFNPRQDPITPEVAQPLDTYSQQQGVLQHMAVRRLTSLECERLMDLPDNYTRIPYRGKPAGKCPDGPRYRALGNSIVVSVLEWIGRRIEVVEGIDG